MWVRNLVGHHLAHSVGERDNDSERETLRDDDDEGADGENEVDEKVDEGRRREGVTLDVDLVRHKRIGVRAYLKSTIMR